MKKVSFGKKKELTISRQSLREVSVDAENRDLIIGFNEPEFKKSRQKIKVGDLDAKLTARLPTYFVPAVEVARMQNKRPRFWVVSGVNMAMKWNAKTERQRKVMVINNRLKFNFLQTFFETFFKDDFSVVEYTVIQDTLRISDEKILELWSLIEERHNDEISEIKRKLAQFKRPKLFSTPTLNEEAQEFLKSQNEDLLNAFKYAIAHIFVFGDVNLEGNYILNHNGFLSIGGHQERWFNKVREFSFNMIKERGSEIFGEKVILKDNLKLVLESKPNTPPSYNGFFRSFGNPKNRGLELDEVTYENKRDLNFYDSHEKLASEMNYMYKNIVSRTDYENFWNGYRVKYFDLKSRYCEAYMDGDDF